MDWLGLKDRFTVITVTTTPQDILKGKCFSIEYCPIALATKRELLPDVEVKITYRRAKFILPNGTEYVIGLPEDAVQFIEYFDYTGTATPVSFDVPISKRFVYRNTAHEILKRMVKWTKGVIHGKG